MIKDKLKKEVSCRALIPLFLAAEKKKINFNLLLKDVPYEQSYLLNKHERIEWWVWRKIISNTRKYFALTEFEKMGSDFVKNGSYVEGVVIGFFMFSGKKFFMDQAFKMAIFMFTCMKAHTEVLSKNKVRITCLLEDDYEPCPEFFLIGKGVWEQFGIQVGKKDFKMILNIVGPDAIYDISWKKEGLGYQIKRWVYWLFNIQQAFNELGEANLTLVKQYEELEASRRLLQKQTTRLKTAHEITKSIRQSLEINKTLNAITKALVNEAKFSSAQIKIFKDIEGNNFEVNGYAGNVEENSNPIIHPVIIDQKKIGELIIYPKSKSELVECEELLTYVLPIVTISIHDSLVLRTITDYKNNLEAKVVERTTELQKAQEKLSKTIHLLRDAQRAQNHFFTNISHEFRTPLTLILGPAKQILERTKNLRNKRDAEIIHRSAKKLNKLANQLLDISRIEAGRMKLKTSRQNLVPLLHDIIFSFHSFAERKNISLEFFPEREEINLYLDRDKIDKILSNIFSNALKFTPRGGVVKTQLSLCFSSEENDLKKFKEGLVEICISDTGIGIPEEQLTKIFNRFYQVDNRMSKEYEGTGVGLSLTKELIELHKGKITVESKEGKGSTFKLVLPLGKDHLIPEEIVEVDFYKESKPEYEPVDVQTINDSVVTLNREKDFNFFTDPNKPLLLIIEDNFDMRKYIEDILNDFYTISEASNGEEGLKKSFDQIPDLIISDIMMPKMDGSQLCSTLKSDSRTSHIPLILLTAKTTLNDKIVGLENGADDYIAKPFEANELLARIKNLLEQRKRLHDHFKKNEMFVVKEEKLTPLDQKFLEEAINIINNNLDVNSFSVEVLAEKLAMSRSLLHKKLNALAGESPNELIKRIRLNKAAKLIECKTGNISEIALEVGFNNPSYFTECFRKQFGCKPSQYHTAVVS